MLYKRTIIKDWQHGILLSNGVIEKVLKPGEYKRYTWIAKKEEVLIYDARPTVTSINDHEVRVKDGTTVVVGVRVLRKITDPEKLVKNSWDNESIVRGWIHSIVNDELSGLEPEEALNNPKTLAKAIEKNIASKLKGLGIEITETPIVSITLPRSLRRAYEAEIIAKKKAKAELEEARGKTAVLRHLANSAEMIKKNPELYKLLLSQKVRSLNIEIND